MVTTAAEAAFVTKLAASPAALWSTLGPGAEAMLMSAESTTSIAHLGPTTPAATFSALTTVRPGTKSALASAEAAVTFATLLPSFRSLTELLLLLRAATVVEAPGSAVLFKSAPLILSLSRALPGMVMRAAAARTSHSGLASAIAVQFPRAMLPTLRTSCLWGRRWLRRRLCRGWSGWRCKRGSRRSGGRLGVSGLGEQQARA